MWLHQIRLCAVLAGALLTGCGFHLRGQVSMPFNSLYVSAPDYSSFGAEFKRYLQSGSKTTLAERPEQADAILQITSENRDKLILSLSSAGRVREYLLRYRVAFRLYDSGNRDWISPGEILLQRDITYDDQAVLGKENEEELLYADMRNDAIQQMVRRLAAVKAPL